MSATAYAYLRVSGDEQADRGLPIAGQREAIQAYADAHDYRIVRWFVDEARVGSTDQRDEFQEMMRAAHVDPPPAQVILLWSWSRFSRSQTDAHYWKASLRRHGVQIRDVSGETPEVEGFEYVLESLIHWKDEQRLREISHDARRGQQLLARHGYIPSGCRPPRGYRVEFAEVELEGRRRRVRRWVPDPETWPLVQRAWRMRLEGASYQTILRECPGLYRSEGCLSTFFANATYKGELTFGGTRVPIEPVVTPEEWARVNRDRLQRASGAYPRRQGSAFLLSGMVRCGLCGAALVGHRTPARRRKDGYSRAPWAGYRCPEVRRGRCRLPYITAAPLEEAVIAQLFRDVLTPEAMGAQWEALRAARGEERPAILARIEALEAELAEAEQALGRILDAIEQAPDSTALLGRLREREAAREEALAELADARAVWAAADVPVPDVTAYRDALREALDVRNDSPELFEAARGMLGRFVDEIRVDGQGAAHVRYRIPF